MTRELLNARGACRRPIDATEVPDLERLAAGLRSIRRAAGLSQLDLAVRVGLAPSTVYRIEAAVRRTRESTLRRMAEVLIAASPRLGSVDTLTADLVRLAGDGLAPESAYRKRIERRRARRLERQMKVAERWLKYLDE